MIDFAFNEITLVVFTTLAPAGAVAFAIMGVAALLSPSDAAANRIERYYGIPVGLVLVGLIASATHLGTPANALYVLTGVGRSPLSNEVVAVAAFIALAGASWVCAFPFEERTPWKKALGGVAVAAALAAVLMISSAYSVQTILTWDDPRLAASLWANALSSGPLVALCSCSLAMLPTGKPHDGRSDAEGESARFLGTLGKAACGVSLVAVVCNVGLLLAVRANLAGIRTTAFSGSELVPMLTSALVGFAAVACLAVLACIAVGRRRGTASPASAIAYAIASVTCLAACFWVRFAFYSLYMTVGI